MRKTILRFLGLMLFFASVGLLAACGAGGLQQDDSDSRDDTIGSDDSDTEAETDADSDTDTVTSSAESDTHDFQGTDTIAMDDTGRDTAVENGTDQLPDTGLDTVVVEDSDSSPLADDQCRYNGIGYQVDASFPAIDGCNTCSCVLLEGTAQVVCTAAACVSPCTSLSESECESSDICRPVVARAMDNQKYCLTSPEYVGCIDADMVCTDAETQAYSSSEMVCWQFSNGCIPDGFLRSDRPSSDSIDSRPDTTTPCDAYLGSYEPCPEALDTDPLTDDACVYDGQTYADGASFPASDGCNQCICTVSADGVGQIACTKMACTESCVELTETQCIAAKSCAPITANIIDPELRCMGDPVFAGCMSADLSCTAVMTFAQKDDQCWVFGGCVPQNIAFDEVGNTLAVCGLDDDNITRCASASCDTLPTGCCTQSCLCPFAGGGGCVPTHWTDDHILMGKCELPPNLTPDDDALCWEQSDCMANQFCEGAIVCRCDHSCLDADRAGACVPASGAECNAELDAIQCEDGYHCHDLGDMGDICLHDAEGLQCWEDGDCEAGRICYDAQLCGPLVNCVSQPGQCVPE